MNLLAIGCSYRTTPVEVRERLAFDDAQITRALDQLANALGHEAVILSTCNRVELYLAPLGPGSEQALLNASNFLANFHSLPPEEIHPHLVCHHDRDAVGHLFRVAASLDSMVLGEGQIAGQVKKAYDRALQQGATGPLLNTLFPHARRVAKRVRTETKISEGSASVSSAAVAYVTGVFDHFGDKTVLVIGAGKMGELTLKNLRNLKPARILVTNRNPDKAMQVAAGCKGEAIPWQRLDEGLGRADIVLSTTGAPEPIMTAERYSRIVRRRSGPVVILDIAVPRDFDPRIHDGDQTFLYNIDDLMTLREETLSRRRTHVTAAEAIIEQETHRFIKDWARRRNGPVIERLTRHLDCHRQEIEKTLFAKLNGKLSEPDRLLIAKALEKLQNQFLHGPISALNAEPPASTTPGGHSLIDAMRKMFGLQE